MSNREALLNDIIDAPDDDAPRLIFADWLGWPRIKKWTLLRENLVYTFDEAARLTDNDWRGIVQRLR